MGKLKSKLYYYLVEKNEAIAREYESVKASKTSTLSRLSALIRLNFHYRILRRKAPLFKIKKAPFQNGSESSLSKREAIPEFVEKLLKYDVISFDIFDTLILRPLASPKDIFGILENRNALPGFREARIAAEKNARRKAPNDEISIYDIYRELREMGFDVQNGEEKELNAEIDYCFENPYMKEVFEALKKAGKEVIIVSDMYFPEEMMKKLLLKTGFDDYAKLYVSCDYGKNKAKGELFNVVLADIKGKRIIHVGDNQSSDVRIPKALGIDSYYYKNCHEIGAAYRPSLEERLPESLFSGILNTHFHSGCKEYEASYERSFALAATEVTGSSGSTGGKEAFIRLFEKYSSPDKELFEISSVDKNTILSFYGENK